MYNNLRARDCPNGRSPRRSRRYSDSRSRFKITLNVDVTEEDQILDPTLHTPHQDQGEETAIIETNTDTAEALNVMTNQKREMLVKMDHALIPNPPRDQIQPQSLE